MNTRPPSPPAYQPPPQVYTGGGVGMPPPSLIHRSNPPSYNSLIPPIAQAHLSPPLSSQYVDGPSRQMSIVGNPSANRNPSQPQRVTYPSSPTTAELWSGNKLPSNVQTQTQATSR